VASSSYDGTVRVWALDGAVGAGAVATLAGHRMDENTVCWMSDGGRLVTGSQDGTVRVFDTSNWALAPRTVAVGGGGVHSVDARASDGLVLAGCKDGGVRVVDVLLSAS
jgi:WD40 repeat protein